MQTLQAETHQFGIVEYSDAEAIEFPLGIPAFETQRRFLLLEAPKSKPVVFLQSLDRPDFCFVTLPAPAVDSSYELSMLPDDLKVLGIENAPEGQPLDDLICLAILSVTESRPTANLLAPIVVNRSSRRGIQAIRGDSRYSHQHPVGALCS